MSDNTFCIKNVKPVQLLNLFKFDEQILYKKYERVMYGYGMYYD